MTRDELIGELARRIVQVKRPHPLKVAIDGADAAGKTMLADELVAPLEKLGRPVIRATIDGFHHPAVVRYRRGNASPEGYFRDSFNYPSLVEALLGPLGPQGDRKYRRAVFDFRLDSAVDAPVEKAPVKAVLVFDGVFLLGPELRPHWDFSVFVQASFELTLARAEVRDTRLFGDAKKVRQRYEERYIPGQRLYLSEVQPERHASVVVDNNDVLRPLIVET